MAEILKEWLTERLQRPIKWEAEQFGDMMKNGHIIATVLHSYHVINEEKLFLIRPSNSPTDIKSNWLNLSEWLREVDVFLNVQELNDIMDGKGSALLRLFYQLFLHLDKRDRTNFLKKERQMVSNLVKKMESRFEVQPVDETQEADVDYLSKPLINEKHYIEWQRIKEKEIKEAHEFVRHRFKNILERIEESKIPCHMEKSQKSNLTSKDRIDIAKFCMKNPCGFKNYTYEELLDLEKEAAERKKSIVDSEWAKAYMDDLYNRINKKTDSEMFQTELRNLLSNSLWNMSLGEEEAQVDITLAKKVMKLSQFEKQMCTQIMETKQQARNLTKNRIEAEIAFADQRHQQFSNYLDNLKQEIHLEVEEIAFEKRRQDVLHQKLYAEKIKRKRQNWYEICYDTMLSIVDYATKYAYWKRLLENDIPEHFIHEWKNLYFKHQPIFDLLIPTEDILKQDALEEEQTQEAEEIVSLEIDRQDALNDCEFIEYKNYLYPWHLELLVPEYEPESEERKIEYLGNRVLGHVVYTLLEMKYPYPPSMPPADLPCFQSKALVCGLPDKAITIPMQTLLNKSKIFVVRLEAAINFCLQQFKQEMIGCTDIELQYDTFISNQPTDTGKELVKSIKSEEETRSKSSDAIYATGPTAPTHKQTQTPKSLPEEDLTLSCPANLGKYAYEALNFGNSLTDHLLAAIIVEYIKNQKNINGFVIINYPNNYREAKILEETFSGREPPEEEDLLQDSDEIYLEETIAKHRKKEKDVHKEVRVSKLVDNPHKGKQDLPFESYFTCYLKMKATDDILREYVIWDLTPENSELIDRFYAALGINYSVYYEVIDKDLLAQICKYIIGDLSTPVKTYSTLFGENVLHELEFVTSDDKRTKSKIIKPETSAVKTKAKSKSGVLKGDKKNSHNNLEVVKPLDSQSEIAYDSVIEVHDTVMEEQSKHSIPVEVKILPGDEEWIYAGLAIPEKIGVALASFWEEIERVYIHDLQQLFFSKRVQMNCLIPYCRFVRDKMEQIITLPSFKQDLVSRFQKEYNEFEDDWRDITVSKNEWHCRIAELQQKLYNICDERKIFAEKQRKMLLMDNWMSEELTSLANTYISCMQAELNRSILTFQILHDFYFVSLKKMPTLERLISKELVKILKFSEDTSASHSGILGAKKPNDDKVYKQFKNAFVEMLLKDTELDFSNNPINMILENNYKFAVKTVRDLNDHYRSVASREYAEVAKTVTHVSKKADQKMSQHSMASDIFRENAVKATEEWIMAVNGEMYRVSQRLLLLYNKCLHDMKLFYNLVFGVFSEIENGINKYYMKEIQSVDRLCKYLQMAVENGKKIPETLILEHDMFIIDPNLLQFEPPVSPDTFSLLDENIDETLDFKLSQLARLRAQFKIVAPNGLILQQAFIYLLQDFIIFGKESCEGPLFPELFKRIDPEQVNKLTYILFGDTAYVDWRDFLIYCLNVRFPTTMELLNLRRRYRCNDCNNTELIDRDDFLAEELWYEKDFDANDPYAQLRRNLMKHFLFELFEVKQDKMNYSALLLAFCKSPDPREGFAMALAMAVGKPVCYLWEECRDVVCMLIQSKQYRDQFLACADECAQKVLDQIIDNVIINCEGTIIEDLGYSIPDNNEEKRSKKDKGKKTDSKKKKARSAPRSLEDNREINARTAKFDSNPNIRERLMTYICSPCDKPDYKLEEESNKEEVQEESSTVSIDSRLAYAVPQHVIWNVLKICLPWHFALIPDRKITPYEQQVQTVMKKLEMNHEDGDIYVSQFLMEPEIYKLLHDVEKFKAYVLTNEVMKVCV